MSTGELTPVVAVELGGDRNDEGIVPSAKRQRSAAQTTAGEAACPSTLILPFVHYCICTALQFVFFHVLSSAILSRQRSLEQMQMHSYCMLMFTHMLSHMLTASHILCVHHADGVPHCDGDAAIACSPTNAFKVEVRSFVKQLPGQSC